MDPVHLIWLFGLAALVGGGIIGAIFYRNLTPTIKEVDSLKDELARARQEMDDYKGSVNSHFDKTSALVNELTQDYVKVYKHLAEGAQALGDNRDLNNILEQYQGKTLISVDDEAKSPADFAEQVSQPPLDAVLPEDDVADNDENIDESTDVIEDVSESVAETDQKQEPVVGVESETVDSGDSVGVAKDEDNQDIEDDTAAKTSPRKAATPASAKQTEEEAVSLA
jgi:uncharacterized membrane-anchored protein YhcB (DUF1043 family)